MSLTSDKEILQVIGGDIIEFETAPPETHYSYNAKFSESETELIDLEIQKLLQKRLLFPLLLRSQSLSLLYSQFLNLMEVLD